jgi:hypothetical protein
MCNGHHAHQQRNEFDELLLGWLRTAYDAAG